MLDSKLPHVEHNVEKVLPDVRHSIGKEDEMHLTGELNVVLLQVLQKGLSKMRTVFHWSISLNQRISVAFVHWSFSNHCVGIMFRCGVEVAQMQMTSVD